MAKAGILLGAGASVNANVPDTKRLTNIILQNLDEHTRRTGETLVGAIAFRNGMVGSEALKVDAEDLLSTLDLINNFQDNPASAIYTENQIFTNLRSAKPWHFDSLRMQIEKIIGEKLWLQNTSTSWADNQYMRSLITGVTQGQLNC